MVGSPGAVTRKKPRGEIVSQFSEEASISNSDVFLTEHAVAMMVRREINSNDLIDAIYNPDEVTEGRGLEVLLRKARIGKADLEVVCESVKGKNSSYLIKVITVHKSIA
jgi:hypothetical protein